MTLASQGYDANGQPSYHWMIEGMADEYMGASTKAIEALVKAQAKLVYDNTYEGPMTFRGWLRGTDWRLAVKRLHKICNEN